MRWSEFNHEDDPEFEVELYITSNVKRNKMALFDKCHL